jgi:hypothetical protein
VSPSCCQETQKLRIQQETIYTIPPFVSETPRKISHTVGAPASSEMGNSRIYEHVICYLAFKPPIRRYDMDLSKELNFLFIFVWDYRRHAHSLVVYFTHITH